MADKKPFDNAAGMRKLLLAGTILVGTIAAGTAGIRAFLGGGGAEAPKGPEVVMAVDGAAEIGSLDKKTNTLTINAGTNIDVMAPGHFMLRDSAGKNSKDMFFNDRLNVKITGPAGNVTVTAHPDVANSRGSTVLAFEASSKGHTIVCDARKVPFSKMAAILNKGEGTFTFIAPQPMDENGFKTSRNPKGTFVTNASNVGAVLVSNDYKGDVSLQTEKGQVRITNQPHNVLQESLKALATPPAVVAAPAVKAGAPEVKLPPAGKIVPPVKAEIPAAGAPVHVPSPEEKLAASKLEVRQSQQKIVDGAIRLRDETLAARFINRGIIEKNPRINEYTRAVVIANFDAVTRNIQGNFDVWIGKMQLDMKVDDITTARQNLNDSINTLKKVEGEFRGNKAEVDRLNKEKAQKDAKEKLSPLSSAGLGSNMYAATVRSFGENSTIFVSATDIYIQRDDGKDKVLDADAVKNPKAQFTQLKITEPGVYDIHFNGAAVDGVAFQITSTHKDATVRVHLNSLPEHLAGEKTKPVEIKAAGAVVIQTDDPKPKGLELKEAGKNTSVELEGKPLIKVVEPKGAVKIQEGVGARTSSLTPIDGFKALAAATQERPTSHAARLERGDFGIG